MCLLVLQGTGGGRFSQMQNTPPQRLKSCITTGHFQAARLRGAMRQHEPRNNNPPYATPVPPPAKGKSAHRWLTATTTHSLLLFAVQGLSLSSWSSEQWLVSHLGRLVMINILFINKALTWHFSFPEGQQHGNHTSSVIQ